MEALEDDCLQFLPVEMKERRAICLICRQSSRYQLSTSQTRRWKTTSEAFVLPRVVIDLDAADNKNVKSFDELSKAEQNLQLQSYHRRNARAPHPQRGFKQLRSGNARKVRHELDSSLATPADVLSYALFGGDKGSSAVRKEGFNSQLKSGKRPTDSILRTVRDTASSFIVNDIERVKKEGFKLNMNDDSFLRKKLENADDIDSLQKVVLILTSTRSGCFSLLRNSDAIVESIRRFRSRQDGGHRTSIRRALRFFNNLRLRLNAMSFEVDRELCRESIFYAANRVSSPALTTYLQLAERSLPKTWYFDKRAPLSLAFYHMAFANAPEVSPYQKEMQKKATSTILTGWEDTAARVRGQYRQASIGRYISKGGYSWPRELYRTYVFVLGQLGFKDDLRLEWEASLVENNNDEAALLNNTLRAHMFAMLFAIAGDSDGGLTILKTIRSGGNKEVQIPSHDDRAVDAGGASDNFSSDVLRKIISQHYRCMQLQAKDDFWRRVGNDLQSIPDDPEKAMAILERYIVQDYQRGEQTRNVQVSNFMGQEVLLITPLRGGKPLFAKVLASGSKSADVDLGAIDGIEINAATDGKERVL